MQCASRGLNHTMQCASRGRTQIVINYLIYIYKMICCVQHFVYYMDGIYCLMVEHMIL